MIREDQEEMRRVDDEQSPKLIERMAYLDVVNNEAACVAWMQ